MKGTKCERIVYKREGSAERRPTSRYSILKLTGMISGKEFLVTQEPQVLERGLTLAEAKVRVTVWRTQAGMSPVDILKGMYP